MTLATHVKNAAHFAQRQRNSTDRRKASAIDAIGAGASQPFGMSASGMSARSGEFYRHFRHWTYVAVNTIAKRVAAQEWKLADVGKDEEKVAGRVATKTHRGQRLDYKEASKLEMIEDHEILDHFANPNDVQNGWEFLYTTVANLMLTGVNHWLCGEREDGTFESWAIPSNWIEAKHEGKLFSSFLLKQPGRMGEGIPVAAENVVRMCFPDPSDLKACISPVITQVLAVTIDQKIQTSQDKAFDNGIFPRVALAVGRNIDPTQGTAVGSPPILTATQRNQVKAAVRRIWQGVARAGEPAILDGLIEKIMPLSQKPNEMDWMKSGEQVKERIFGAFSLHPFLTGQQAPGSYAQMAVVEKVACENVFNPLAGIISQGGQKVVQGFGSNLLAWLSPCEPTDPKLRWDRFMDARKNDDITQDELRTELGLEPLGDNRPLLARTHNGLREVTNLLTRVGEGVIDEDKAKKVLGVFFGKMDEEGARVEMDREAEILMKAVRDAIEG